ncbi:MAG: tetratricopeptide repeat protein, partial [Chitinophagaceae bacterium]
HDLQPLGSIKEFMARIKSTDFVLMILSDNYLKSPNCMYEVMDFFSSKDFVERMLPIQVEGLDIFSGSGRTHYLKHWEDKIKEVNTSIKSLESIAFAGSIQSEIEHFSTIRTRTDDFFKVITDRKIFALEVLRKENYRSLLERVGVKDISLYNQIMKAQSLKEQAQEIAVTELIRKFPDHNNVLYLKAYVEGEKGRNDVAAYYYKEILKTERSNEGANLNLTISLINLKEYDEAMRYARRTIAINPNNAVAHFCLAELMVLSLNDEAMDHYLKAIELNANWHEPYFSLGRFLKKQGRLDEALACFVNAHKSIKPESINTIQAIIEIYESLEDYGKAYKWLQRAYVINPHNETIVHKLNLITSRLPGYTITQVENISIEAPVQEVLPDLTNNVVSDELLEIRAPMFGKFYVSNFVSGYIGISSNYHGSTETSDGNYSNGPPLVHVGDYIKKGQLIATIACLGKQHEVKSKVEGYLKWILVKDAEYIHWNQALFLLKPV